MKSIKLKNEPQKLKDRLKKLVITKQQGARGDALITLFKMRYGKEWRDAMPKNYNEKNVSG